MHPPIPGAEGKAVHHALLPGGWRNGDLPTRRAHVRYGVRCVGCHHEDNCSHCHDPKSIVRRRKAAAPGAKLARHARTHAWLAMRMITATRCHYKEWPGTATVVRACDDWAIAGQGPRQPPLQSVPRAAQDDGAADVRRRELSCRVPRLEFPAGSPRPRHRDDCVLPEGSSNWRGRGKLTSSRRPGRQRVRRSCRFGDETCDAHRALSR
jgi:hypothetical protein